jgi:predicted Rossmann fold flavoprotein
MKNLLRAFGLPQSLNEKLLKLSSIPYDLKAAELNKKDRSKLIKALSACPLTVRELEGYNRAMTTRGGVSLKEVNPKTMESRIIPGLFFAGELLNIDGDTGGFNLQAAFSTGRMAGRNAYLFASRKAARPCGSTNREYILNTTFL